MFTHTHTLRMSAIRSCHQLSCQHLNLLGMEQSFQKDNKVAMGKTFHSFWKDQSPQVLEGKAAKLDPPCIENGWVCYREHVREEGNWGRWYWRGHSMLCLGTSKARKSNTQVDPQSIHLALNLTLEWRPGVETEWCDIWLQCFCGILLFFT